MVVEKVSAIPAIFMVAHLPSEARKLPPHMRENFANKRCEVLRAVRKGVFLVFLDSRSTHCMVADGFGRVIVDSMDPYLSRLSAATPNQCSGGDGQTKENVSARQNCKIYRQQ